MQRTQKISSNMLIWTRKFCWSSRCIPFVHQHSSHVVRSNPLQPVLDVNGLPLLGVDNDLLNARLNFVRSDSLIGCLTPGSKQLRWIEFSELAPVRSTGWHGVQLLSASENVVRYHFGPVQGVSILLLKELFRDCSSWNNNGWHRSCKRHRNCHTFKPGIKILNSHCYAVGLTVHEPC